MSRAWTEFVAGLDDRLPWPMIGFLMLLAAGLIGVLWYFFPAWIPRRLPRFHRPDWRLPKLRWPTLRWRFAWNWRWLWGWWRRRKDDDDIDLDALADTPDDELPDLPVEAFLSLADRLAAAGRYAEAVRERLRAIVRDLVDRQVIEHRPGWTVTELARAAATARPGVDPPLSAAGRLFSDIWYGQRPAVADDDARMRELSSAVRSALHDRTKAPV